jgi:hypothetical protein
MEDSVGTAFVEQRLRIWQRQNDTSPYLSITDHLKESDRDSQDVFRCRPLEKLRMRLDLPTVATDCYQSNCFVFVVPVFCD